MCDFEGMIHPKMTVLSLFTSFQTCGIFQLNFWIIFVQLFSLEWKIKWFFHLEKKLKHNGHINNVLKKHNFENKAVILKLDY